MLQEFAQWIEDKTAWDIGKDLFVGHLPEYLPETPQTAVPERCIAVLEPTPSPVDSDLLDRVNKIVQILNRASTYFTARADAQALFARLHGATWIYLPVLAVGEEYVIWSILAEADPYPSENPGESGLYVFVTNYVCIVSDKSA